MLLLELSNHITKTQGPYSAFADRQSVDLHLKRLHEDNAKLNYQNNYLAQQFQGMK